LLGAIARDVDNRQIFSFDAYGNLLGWQSAQPMTTYLYSGESFDFQIGQQYLRARFYDPTTGRFTGLDPFSGNSEDPQSFHKYGYVHGDPVQGVDPSGLFVQALYLRAKSAAASLSTYMSIQASLRFYQIINQARIISLIGYNAVTYASVTAPIWLPKLDFAMDVAELGLTFMVSAADAIEHMSADVEQALNAERSDTKRGVILENATPANLRGTVEGIDDVQFNENSEAFVTSVRSHNVKDARSLLKAIRADSNELYDKSRRWIEGTTGDGMHFELDPDQVRGRGLVIIVPYHARYWVAGMAKQLRQMAEYSDMVIQIIPSRKWKVR
jgi:RHS repeat-associated protein